MKDEIVETAKATQEVAKTASVAIKATEKLGIFLSKIIGEPTEIAIGILSDKLRFIRWQNQIKLADRLERIMKDRKIEGKSIPVSPRFAIPLLESASWEDRDSLQEIWANLLISAMHPDDSKKVRSSFIEIIKQIEPEEARLLKEAYELATNNPRVGKDVKHFLKGRIQITPPGIPISKDSLCSELNISDDTIIPMLDNLFRLRCLAPFAENTGYSIAVEGRVTKELLRKDFVYSTVCITRFGVLFIETCINPSG